MKVVFTAAVMDLCHKGHINLMQKMREEAGPNGRVIVILHDDRSIYETKGRIPIQNLRQRVDNVKIVGIANEVLVCSDYTDLARKFEEIINYWNSIDFENQFLFMRGNDWKGKFPAQDTLEKHNIPIKFIEYTAGISSTFLREHLENESRI